MMGWIGIDLADMVHIGSFPAASLPPIPGLALPILPVQVQRDLLRTWSPKRDKGI